MPLLATTPDIDLKPLLITALSTKQSLYTILTELEQQQLLSLSNIQQLLDSEFTYQHGLDAILALQQLDLSNSKLEGAIIQYIRHLLHDDGIKAWILRDTKSPSEQKALAKAALPQAASRGYEVMLNNLLAVFSEEERLALINEVNEDGRTLLQAAVSSGNDKAFAIVLALYPKSLLSLFAEKHDAHGNTLLHLAAKTGNGKIFQTILELYPAEERLTVVKASNHNGHTVLDYASRYQINSSATIEYWITEPTAALTEKLSQDPNSIWYWQASPQNKFIIKTILQCYPEEERFAALQLLLKEQSLYSINEFLAEYPSLSPAQRLTALSQAKFLGDNFLRLLYYFYEEKTVNLILHHLTQDERAIILQHKNDYYESCDCTSYCSHDIIYYESATLLHKAAHKRIQLFANILGLYDDQPAQLAALNELMTVRRYPNSTILCFSFNEIERRKQNPLAHLLNKNPNQATCDYVYALLQRFSPHERYQLCTNFWEELLIQYCFPKKYERLASYNLLRYFDLLTMEDKFQLIKIHAELIVKYYQQQHLPQTDFEALVLISAEAAKIQAHWQRLTGSPLNKIIALLQEYTGYNSSTYRFFTGAWNRHHLEKVQIIINAFSPEQIEEEKQGLAVQQLLAGLEAIELDNPMGRLGILRVVLKHQFQQLSASIQDLKEDNVEQRTNLMI